MKKSTIIFIIALFLPLALPAQTKKIAMLEPLGTNSTMFKNSIRDKLADAFINYGDCKAYIRSDIDQLMNEFNFQENGMINDEQRKNLRRVSGAELMCITHITSEENYSFVECRLVELKSGIAVKAVNLLMQNTPDTELDKGCYQLAIKLVGRVARLDGGKRSKSSGDIKRNGEIYNPDGIEMVYVAGAGKHGMVTKAYYIARFEITQAQWKAIMKTNPSHFKGDNLPVEMVSWNDIQKFLSKLNKATGRKYRLPTEAEWEFAARGGTAISFCLGDCGYSGSNNIDDVAWYKNNSDEHTHPVGAKNPNELGIYDMSGNVWEWCESKYEHFKRHRCVRGGSWYRDEAKCGVFFRAHDAPNVQSDNIGFRVVLPL
jgi:hypothetical protein